MQELGADEAFDYSGRQSLVDKYGKDPFDIIVDLIGGTPELLRETDSLQFALAA